MHIAYVILLHIYVFMYFLVRPTNSASRLRITNSGTFAGM